MDDMQTTEASGTIISTLTAIMIVSKTQDGMTDINDNKYLILCVSTKNLKKLNINYKIAWYLLMYSRKFNVFDWNLKVMITRFKPYKNH